MKKKENNTIPGAAPVLELVQGQLVEAFEIAVPSPDILLEITSYPNRKKKVLLTKLVRAKLHYEKARRRYRKAKKAYLSAVKQQQHLQLLAETLKKAELVYQKKKAKLQKIQEAVNFYFGDRPRQLMA